MSHIRAIVAEQGITFLQGDILFLRVGFTAKYNTLSPPEQQAFPDRQPGGLLGLEATMDSLRWVWETGFAAVASDSPSFERGPTTGPYNDPDVSFHQWGLAGWGMPLGEMFDLEELAEACRERKRWSFFVCSLPMRVSCSSGMSISFVSGHPSCLVYTHRKATRHNLPLFFFVQAPTITSNDTDLKRVDARRRRVTRKLRRHPLASGHRSTALGTTLRACSSMGATGHVIDWSCNGRY